MGKVTTGFSMSLDGFIALPNNEIGPLFDWFTSGDTNHEVPMGEGTLKVNAEGAEMIQEAGKAAGHWWRVARSSTLPKPGVADILWMYQLSS